MKAERLPGNPIIHPGLAAEIGENINGPSLIRAPSWLPDPLGRYYLYFAHHGGTSIRLAVADGLTGPWRVIPGGTLQLAQTACHAHVASPDVHVNEEQREIRMYFHGPAAGHQKTFLATSPDGLHFTAGTEILAPFYLRVFEYAGAFYGIAKDCNQGGVLVRSPDGVSPFDPGPNVIPRMRHAAVRRCADSLELFFSRGEDCPERILYSQMSLAGNWHEWQPSAPVELLAPETEWEGGDLPLTPSSFGAIHGMARQLRDPALYEEAGRWFLLYSVAGESGLAIAEVSES
ncbi:MAG: hypothetical protein HN849_25025 [Victivallales bacterium]|nr:hypothetical protein [Victivallales bacterium]